MLLELKLEPQTSKGFHIQDFYIEDDGHQGMEYPRVQVTPPTESEASGGLGSTAPPSRVDMESEKGALIFGINVMFPAKIFSPITFLVPAVCFVRGLCFES